MHAVKAALAGAAVVTSSKRLSRALNREFQQAKRAEGLSVWRSPAILPFNAFVGKCFGEWLYSGAPRSAPVTLNEVQELAVWEHIIGSAEPDALLQLHGTAVAAREAWKLAVAWRVPVSRGRLAVSEDCEAFGRWAERWVERCRDENWLDRARVADFVRERVVAGEIEPPARVALAGFDELTPQQRDLVEALRGKAQSGNGQIGLFAPPLRSVEESERPSFQSTPAVVTLRDAEHELTAAAGWARNILTRDPRARVGIIVPELPRVRARVDRVFADVLQPGGFANSDKPYHLSAGPPLADHPLVHAALLMLTAGLEDMSVPDAGVLLRSPFLKGGIAERDARAGADVDLRKSCSAKATIDHLCRAASRCPVLQGALNGFVNQRRAITRHQAPSAWSTSFTRLLGTLGWPGDRDSDSREYQTIAAWNEALSALATLDMVVGPLDYRSALSRLRRIAGMTMFQPENEDAPVQVMGTLEAAGLTFDHVWIAGLDDGTTPPPARPNPFLPVSVQRQRGMPRSSAERELAFARQTLERLVASAPHVVLSHAQMDGDRELRASPLIAGLSTEAVPSQNGGPRRWFSSAALEEISDEAGPPLEGAQVSGGVGLLKATAACPFQAFVRYRLNARGLEEGDFGISAMDKGTGVHTAMAEIWGELGSLAGLRQRTPDQLRDLVRTAAANAVAGNDALHAIERERLEHVLLHWLQAVEMQRPPFTVEHCELKQNASVGGLDLKVRVDRIDRLQDGSLAIIDYKTGEVNSAAWEDERVAEPQLPLYAVTCSDTLGAVAIAQVRRDDPVFRGIGDGIPMKRMRSATDSLANERDRWRRSLNLLAGEFRAGVARVDPAKDACKFCDFRALCRVDEGGAAVEDSGNGAE